MCGQARQTHRDDFGERREGRPRYAPCRHSRAIACVVGGCSQTDHILVQPRHPLHRSSFTRAVLDATPIGQSVGGGGLGACPISCHCPSTLCLVPSSRHNELHTPGCSDHDPRRPLGHDPWRPLGRWLSASLGRWLSLRPLQCPCASSSPAVERDAARIRGERRGEGEALPELLVPVERESSWVVEVFEPLLWCGAVCG